MLRLRLWLLKKLIGPMEVCANMDITGGNIIVKGKEFLIWRNKFYQASTVISPGISCHDNIWNNNL